MSEQLTPEVVQSSPPQIPDRLFFRIGDVGELAGVETYVLRFWESEFPMLAPKKTSNGQRQYRRKDVETVFEIKRLLYNEGYTIAGARKVLQDRGKQRKRVPEKKEQNDLPFSPPPAPSTANAAPAATPEHPSLGAIRRELEEILALLKDR